MVGKLRGSRGGDGTDRVFAYRDGDVSPAGSDDKSSQRGFSSEDDGRSADDLAESSQHGSMSDSEGELANKTAWSGIQMSSLQSDESSVDGTSLPGIAVSSSRTSSSRSNTRPVGGRAAGRFAPGFGFGRGAGRGGIRGGGRWSRASRARVKQGLPPLPDDRVAPRLSTARQGKTGAALLDLINDGVAALTPEPEPDESSDSELDELQCEVDKFEAMAKKQAEALVGLNPLSDSAWVKQHSAST